MTTLEIQRRLAALGYDPGPLDGIRGRLTIKAVKAFQRANGLAADGLVGAKTAAALSRTGGASRPPSAPRDEGGEALPWLEEGRRWLGLAETVGRGSNPVILRWGQAVASWFTDDDIPWCGAFAHGVLAASLPEEPLPANALWARGWLRFGRACPPRPGAVLVFSRGRSSGHVGFHVGEDAQAFHVLGGNQSNRVSVTRIARSRLLGARWPRSAPMAEASRPGREVFGSAAATAADGALSTDEA